MVIAGLRRAVPGRGGGSFANDCVGHETFTYNAIRKATGCRVYLCASQDIQPGQEVFWKYAREQSNSMAVAMGKSSY